MTFADMIVYSDNSINHPIRMKRDGGLTYAGVATLLTTAIKHSQEWLENIGYSKENWRTIPFTEFVDGVAYITLQYGRKNPPNTN